MQTVYIARQFCLWALNFVITLAELLHNRFCFLPGCLTSFVHTDAVTVATSREITVCLQWVEQNERQRRNSLIVRPSGWLSVVFPLAFTSANCSRGCAKYRACDKIAQKMDRKLQPAWSSTQSTPRHLQKWPRRCVDSIYRLSTDK